VTQYELFALVAAFLTLLGAVSGAWWRVESKIKESRDQTNIAIDAANARASLALAKADDLRVHVAENYTSQKNLNAMRDEIMAAISKIGDRVDRVIEAPKPSRVRAAR
jgi:hypothetical protein